MVKAGDKRILDAAAPILGARLATYSVPPTDAALAPIVYEALRGARFLVETHDRIALAERQHELESKSRPKLVGKDPA